MSRQISESETPPCLETPVDRVRWHDIECGDYKQDLALWRNLALQCGAKNVLDVGAGTGRVAFDLASRGFAVTANDIDQIFCDELALRAKALNLSVNCFCANACSDSLGSNYDAILVPMQSLQLFSGSSGRIEFFKNAAQSLVNGGTLAFSVVEDVELFDDEDGSLVAPDMREYDGVLYSSRPTSISSNGPKIFLRRLREITGSDGTYSRCEDLITLYRVSVNELTDEATSCGFSVTGTIEIPATDDHIGSTIMTFKKNGSKA